MSIVVVTLKNGRAAIASDSQTTIGDVKLSASRKCFPSKIHAIPGGFFAMTGFAAMETAMENLLAEYPDVLDFNGPRELFSRWMQVHELLKANYALVSLSDGSAPLESSGTDALFAHRSGIFGLTGLRHITAYNSFWAMGSGRDFALGALSALNARYKTAESLARAAAEIACEYDCGCGLPVFSHSVETLVTPASVPRHG